MPFERDLGYLAKFFDKLEAHAGGLDTPRARRLRELIVEERARWQKIVALLEEQGEEAAHEAPERRLTAGAPRDEVGRPVLVPHRAPHGVPAPPPPRAAMGTELTVGSLFGKGE